MSSRKKFEKVFYYDYPIVKQYFWYSNCVGLRPTGHLVTGNRYRVASGTASTYVNSYTIPVLVSCLNFGGVLGSFLPVFGHKFDL